MHILSNLTCVLTLSVTTAMAPPAVALAKKSERPMDMSKQLQMTAAAKTSDNAKSVKSSPRIGVDIAIDFLPTDF